MRRTTHLYIGIGAFLGCWLLLFLLPCVVRNCPLSELVRLTDGISANFLILNMIFAGVAIFVVLLADTAAVYFRRFKPFRPKLGEVLVHRGYVTAEQLESALRLQKLRIGEVLCHMGCLTDGRLHKALRLQQEGDSRRIGEILMHLGYVSARDLQRGLDSLDRKLGRILIDMGLIQKDQLRTVLGRLWYARRHGL